MKYEIYLVGPDAGDEPELVATTETRELAETWRQEWARDPVGLQLIVKLDGEVIPPSPDLVPAEVDDDLPCTGGDS